jgi:hypothetical protein
MMKMISYRLAQYKIIENENGDLWWECYADFATTNSGKCFIAGNILFLEPYSEVSEPGYLILEYNELLNKLPRWEKTKYYCSSYTLRPSKTGRILPKKELSKRSCKRTERVKNSVTTEGSGNGGIEPKQSDETKAISYRLAQYEIMEGENGEVWWKAHAGLGRVRHGKCFIEDSILFIGASNADVKKPGEPGFLRREFITHLNQLPQWEKTKYYCSGYTLRSCKTPRILPKKELSKRPRERTQRLTNRVTTEDSGNGGIEPKQPDQINAKLKLSGERTENTVRQLISQMCSAVISFRQLHKGDTYVRLKKYTNRAQKWIVSMGARLLLICTGLFALLSHRLKRRQNGSYQETQNWQDDVHNNND